MVLHKELFLEEIIFTFSENKQKFNRNLSVNV